MTPDTFTHTTRFLAFYGIAIMSNVVVRCNDRPSSSSYLAID